MDRNQFKKGAIYFLIVGVSLFFCYTGIADPGNFWYGLYNVPPGAYGDTTYRVISEKYHMNWARTSITEAYESDGVLDSAESAGVAIMQCDPHEIGQPKDSALIFWVYSSAAHLDFQAEGDTIVYQWHPASSMGVYVRHNDSGAGSAVFDTMAVDSFAWLFDPGVDSTMDSVYVIFHGRGPNCADRDFYFPFRFRAEAAECTGDLLHFYLYRTPGGEYIKYLAGDTLTCEDFADTTYLPNIQLDYRGRDKWGLFLVVRWLGKAKVWVDWFGVQDKWGRDLVNSEVDNDIIDYINRYSFNGAPGIIGFYMREERWEDANVYPQKRVDSLIKEAGLIPFTEHHLLEWWEDRQQYGRRNAIAARLQPGTPNSGLLYPYSGYHFERLDALAKAIRGDLTPPIDTIPGVLEGASNDPCEISGDTAICLQEKMDGVARHLTLYKGLADSTSNKYVPFLQAYAHHTRLKPDSCHHDTNPPWQVGMREQSREEASLLASMALAYGANGLLYYTLGSYGTIYIPDLILKCEDGTYDTIPSWLQQREWRGLSALPDMQDALEFYVGPLVDSLGYLFYDFEWQGAGRLDIDTNFPGKLIDSVRSLTHTDPDDEAFIEGGFFKQGNEDYVFLVNRRAYDSVAQEFQSWLALDSGMYYIVDAYRYDTLLTGSLPGGGIPFTTTIEPGEGKLFRIISIDSTGPLPAGMVPNKLQGRVAIAGKTIAEGQNLDIYHPAVIRLGTDARIEVDGTLNAIGTENQKIKFVSANATPEEGDWDWIKIVGGGEATFEYCEFKHAYKCVWAIAHTTDSTHYDDSLLSVSIDQCLFDSIQVCGIEFWTVPVCTLEVMNSEIRDCGTYGVRVIAGLADVRNNTFRSQGGYCCLVGGDGSYVVGGLVDSNTFADDQTGLTSGWALFLYMLNHSEYSGNVFQARYNFIEAYNSSDVQGGICLFNCDDTVVLRSNQAINNVDHGYGILNFSSPTVIVGDTVMSRDSNSIDSWIYGLACFGSESSDPDYPTVRQMSFSINKYDVWVQYTSNCDLGMDGDYGYNYLYGRIWHDDTLWTVYNNSSDTVPAIGNYWFIFPSSASPLTEGPVDASSPLSYNPFPSKLAIRQQTEEELISEVVRLDQNYPNPFNLGTRIQFELPEANRVTISIYNILGQRISDLVDKEFPAGTHQVNWDGKDIRGTPVATGIYFYRVEAGNFVESKKMLIIK